MGKLKNRLLITQCDDHGFHEYYTHADTEEDLRGAIEEILSEGAGTSDVDLWERIVLPKGESAYPSGAYLVVVMSTQGEPCEVYGAASIAFSEKDILRRLRMADDDVGIPSAWRRVDFEIETEVRVSGVFLPREAKSKRRKRLA